MRVLHLIDHLGIGGSQTQLLDLLEARGPEIEPTVWCLSRRVLPEFAERLRRAEVPLRILGFSKVNPLPLINLRRRMAETRADLVHAHLEFSSVLAAAATGRTGPPVVLHVENDIYQRPRLARWALQRLVNRVSGYIAISNGSKNSALRAFGPRAGPLVLVPPGIDLERFGRTVDPAVTAGFRGGASRVVGSVGRFSDQKAFHVLLEAAPQLLADDPGTRILLVGDGPLQTRLERQAERLGISHAVTFAGPLTDLRPAYSAMDVFVLPSRYEGFGIVFLEAMACGVPVVGTRVVGSEEAVEDGVTGLLVPFGDAKALARAVLRLFSEPELRERLRKAALDNVVQEHSREGAAARTESFYRELTAPERGLVHV